MVAMAVPVELAADDIGVTVGEGVEAHGPLVESTFRRYMSNNVNLLVFLLGFLQLLLDPLEHCAWVSGVSEQVPVLTVLRLGIH